MRLAALCDDRLRLRGIAARSRSRGLALEFARGRSRATCSRRCRAPVPTAAASSPTRGQRGGGRAGRCAASPPRPTCPALIAEEPRAALARVAARFFGRAAANRRGGDRDQRQELGRRVHASALGRSRPQGGEPRHARAADLGRAGRGQPDHAGPDHAAPDRGRTRGRGRPASGDRGVQPRPRPAPRRRPALSRCRLHQSQPRPFRLSRQRRPPTTPPSAGCSPSCWRQAPPRSSTRTRRSSRTSPGLPSTAGCACSTMASAAGRCGCSRRTPTARRQELELELLGPPQSFRNRRWSAPSRRATCWRPPGSCSPSGATVDAVLPLLAGLRAPPGRMQLVAQPSIRCRRPSSTTPTSPRRWPRRWRRLRPTHGRAPGRRVRLRRRPRCRQAAADGRDREPARGRGDRHRRQSAQRGSRPRSGARSWRRHPGARRDRRPGRGDPRRVRRPARRATRCSWPARATRPTRSSATGSLPFDDAEILRDAARAAGEMRCDRAVDRRGRGAGHRRDDGRRLGRLAACRSTRARWRRATCSWRWRARTATRTPSWPHALERGAAAAVVSRMPEGVADPASLVLVDRHAGGARRARAQPAGGAPRRGSPASPAASARPAPRRRCATSWRAQAPTHASAASYNNQWGVPLSLARLPEAASYGVFELGMNHAGEIRALTAQVRPHVALITTIAPAHLEFFASVEAIADAKGEIFEGLEPGGVADRSIATASIMTRLRAHAERSRAGADRHLRPPSGGRLAAGGAAACRRSTARSSSIRGGRQLDLSPGLARRASGAEQPGRARRGRGAGCRRGARGRGRSPICARPAGRGERRRIAVPGGAGAAARRELQRQSGLDARGPRRARPDARPARSPCSATCWSWASRPGELHAGAGRADRCARPGRSRASPAARRWRGCTTPCRQRGAAPTPPIRAALAPAVLDALRPGDVVLVKGSLGSRMARIVGADPRRAQPRRRRGEERPDALQPALPARGPVRRLQRHPLHHLPHRRRGDDRAAGQLRDRPGA